MSEELPEAWALITSLVGASIDASRSPSVSAMRKIHDAEEALHAYLVGHTAREQALQAKIDALMLERYATFERGQQWGRAQEQALWRLNGLTEADTSATASGAELSPLSKEQVADIWIKTSEEVSRMEAEHRYEFASWLGVAVRLTEAAHGITPPQQEPGA